jgi:hypothetical protein
VALFLFPRRGPQKGDGGASPADALAEPGQPAPRRLSISPGELRRERRALLRERETLVSDLGGLVLEMFRQDSFREHLLHERAAEVQALDERLFEVERLLGARRPPAARCACGAPIFWGSHFCGNCGRPVGEPVVACSSCGHALTADARYCPGCGAGTPAAEGE